MYVFAPFLRARTGGGIWRQQSNLNSATGPTRRHVAQKKYPQGPMVLRQDLRRDLLNLTDFAETKDMGQAVKEGYITEELRPKSFILETQGRTTAGLFSFDL